MTHHSRRLQNMLSVNMGMTTIRPKYTPSRWPERALYTAAGVVIGAVWALIWMVPS